jgi:hypothetical protein
VLIIGVGLVALAVLGAIGWLIVRRGRPNDTPFEPWADAACPACLTLAVLGREEP